MSYMRKQESAAQSSTNHNDHRRRERPQGWLKMKELAQAVGLPKSAILHYISQGLLPEPIRTGQNMAYYDPACAERIRFVKSMRESYSFPLRKIKLLLENRDRGINIDPLIELNKTVFGAAPAEQLSERAFRSETGLDAAQVRALVGNRLLLPLEPGRFDRQDVEIGRVYAEGLALGISAGDLAFYAEEAEKIIDKEMKLRERFTAHLTKSRDAELTRGLVQAARATRLYVIDRMFQKRIASASDLQDKELCLENKK